jgi:hypothetical protein
MDGSLSKMVDLIGERIKENASIQKVSSSTSGGMGERHY